MNAVTAQQFEILAIAVIAAIVGADFGDGGMTNDGATRKAIALVKLAIQEQKKLL
jgi:hypothetical protein